MAELAGGLAPVFVCLTKQSVQLAKKIKSSSHNKWEIHGLASRCPEADILFDQANNHIVSLFLSGRPILGICAAGILIRALGPHLISKFSDAPVIAIAEDGSAIIPLLSSHHGGMALARKIAAATGGHLALTTAGDVRLGVSLDCPPKGFKLADERGAKAVMGRILDGGGVSIASTNYPETDYPEMDEFLAPLPKGQEVRISITTKAILPGPDHLVYHPLQLFLGVGCVRGCGADHLIEFVHDNLSKNGLAAGAIAAIVSVDLKGDEPAIRALSEELSCPIRLFTPDELEALTPRIENPSDIVFAEIGCHSVAEASALLAAGDDGALILSKTKTSGAAIAIAKASSPAATLKGRKPGRVFLVGIGPGRDDWRTPEASQMIARADILCGYKLYLDLLGPLAGHHNRREFALGEEEMRCRFALEEAAKGLDVAIICSGDAGIYAMGALVFELLDRKSDAGGVSAMARRVQVITTPGITAMQAAAARSGALLGHDFCAISLSDLLTPWEVIEQRLHGAGAGDFAIAFYNPVSMRRRTQLAKARDILLTYRKGDTPVVLATNLGRPQERIRYRTLASLDLAEIDMLTVVLVGSSQTRRLDLGRGQAVYTPRGYAKKSKIVL